MKIVSKKEFNLFVKKLLKDDYWEIVGPQPKETKYVYGKLEKPGDLDLSFDVTLQSPKKYFLPPRETLLKFNRKKEKQETVDPEEVNPRIIIGIYPYDLVAIHQMDKVFEDPPPDQHYLKKREKSVLIGVNMQNVSEKCFAASMETATVEDHYDLMLTDLGEKFAIEIGSRKGSKLLNQKEAGNRNATRKEVQEKQKKEKQIFNKFDKKLDLNPGELPTLLEKNFDNKKFWEKHAEKCYSCGTCNLVCPTCYCFDVRDKNELNLQEGERKRQWSGCNLEEFALVAAGENFREEKHQRYRHRYMRKGNYIYERFGDIACVGCGRCSTQCIPDIADPCRIFNELKEVDKNG